MPNFASASSSAPSISVNNNTSKTMKTSSIGSTAGFGQPARELPVGAYLTFMLTISGADFTASHSKDGSSVLRFVKNGVIMNSAKNGVFGEFRLINEDKTKITAITAHDGAAITTTYGAPQDAVKFLADRFLGQDTKFKFDLPFSAADFMEACEDEDAPAKTLLVTVDARHLGSLNPNPKEYNGSKWNEVKLAVVDVRPTHVALPYGISLSGDEIVSGVQEGRYAVASQSYTDILAARDTDVVVAAKKAKKAAKNEAARARRLAAEAEAPITTQAAAAAAPDAEKDALRKENAELKAQVADLTANVANLTTMMQQFMASQGQAAPAPAPEAPAEVAEEAPAPLFISDEDDLADIAEADEADEAEVSEPVAPVAVSAVDPDEETAEELDLDIFADVAAPAGGISLG